MPYAKIIVNPVAGAGRTGKKWPEIMHLLKHFGLPFEHELTEAPGHAIELAKAAAKDGYEQVVSVGGDGTVNEVVNGLYDSGNLGNIMLGIISTGTGQDYVRTLGIPRLYPEICSRLASPRKLLVDIGVIEYWNRGEMTKRLFVNFAGMGFDAEIVRRTTQNYKTLGSNASYLAGLVSTLLFYENKEISLAIDGEVVARKVCAVIMNNGKYGGGGMLAAPDADLTDGFLDVLVIGDLAKPDLLWSLPRIYKGTHLTHPKVTMKRAREVEIRSDKRLLLQADGELLGEVPARFYLLPAVLNVVI